MLNGENFYQAETTTSVIEIIMIQLDQNNYI